ncbi:MAG: helix-turn-helix domain-containing protein [Chromatiaceae bacterium]|nr:helix-turn-helix domain-containing protein [Chromatiaceae bacterium]MBP7983390.1 helix-turn-helix domain-containing protein [Chromatiaceae bacterium]MBP8289815.1 helix-turn-helix domain-containing protein [Chromatiaceae bacterium]
MKQHATPKKASRQDWHPADVVAALRKAGWSLRRLSLANGYAAPVLCRALSGPYLNAERIVAAALGLEPWDIWPSRYDENHQHCRRRAQYPVVLPHRRGPRTQKDSIQAAPANGNPGAGDRP